MDAQEWVNKRGVYNDDGTLVDCDGNEVEIMDGNLENMACECGARDQFMIEVTVVADVYDSSIDPDHPDYSSFNNDSYCKCCSCEEEGYVSDFKVQGLDKLLRTILDAGPDEEEQPDPKQVEELANIISTPPPPTTSWDTSGLTQ